MKLWLVRIEKEYGDWYYNTMVFHAVFESELEARKYCDTHKGKFEIDEIELDKPINEIPKLNEVDN